MKMKDFDFLLCTQMTVERAMFAFMLQLSFYQNIFPFSFAASYRQYINVRSTFTFRDIEWGFPQTQKAAQHGFRAQSLSMNGGKALVKLINGTFHHRMS
jgi:hypothetical protein